MSADDLPTWNLGLNFDLDRASASIVSRLHESIQSLSREFGRDFVVGYFDLRSKTDEDIGFIVSAKDCTGITQFLEKLARHG